MGGSDRPSPVLTYSPTTSGWIQYFRSSLATVTFGAPLGIRPQLKPTWLTTGLPSLVSGKPCVAISWKYQSGCSALTATSVDSVPSTSITMSCAWKALLSSASFQLTALGGT